MNLIQTRTVKVPISLELVCVSRKHVAALGLALDYIINRNHVQKVFGTNQLEVVKFPLLNIQKPKNVVLGLSVRQDERTHIIRFRPFHFTNEIRLEHLSNKYGVVPILESYYRCPGLIIGPQSESVIWTCV